MVATDRSLDTLDIRISRGHDLGYNVELRLGEREFPPGVLDPAVITSVGEAGPDEAGTRLFAALISDERVRMAWNLAAALAPRRRIRLRIDEAAPELHTLPWEGLRDVSPSATEREPAADRDTPFSRLVPWSQALPPAIDERPVRVLSAVAAPSDLDVYRLPPIERDAEIAGIADAMALAPAGLVEHTALKGPCTLAALEAALEAGYHVLHLVAHGVARRDGELALFLEKNDGTVDRIDGSNFAAMLERLGRELRLTVLMVCSSAVRSPGDARIGLAPRLLAAGVPAVLAMQDLMPVDTGRAFTRALYGELWSGGEVDRAANRARATLLTSHMRGSAVPVLYSALAGNRLFTSAAPAPAQTPGIQTPSIPSPAMQAPRTQTSGMQTHAQQPMPVQAPAPPDEHPVADTDLGPWAPIGGPFRQFTTIRGRDGCVDLFAVGFHEDTLHCCRQVAPGGAWGPWDVAPDAISVAATLDGRGRVVQFAHGQTGSLWVRRRVTPTTWNAWGELGCDGELLAVGCYADDLMIAVTVASDGLMYSNEEIETNGEWSDWVGEWENDDETHVQIAVARDGRRLLSVFSLHDDHTLWQSRQKGDDYSGWKQIGAEIQNFSVVADRKGHLFIAAVGDDGGLRMSGQTAPGGPWAPWQAQHDARLVNVHVAAYDEGITIHAIDEHGRAGTIAPTFTPLSGPGFATMLAVEAANSVIMRLALDHEGMLYQYTGPG